MLNLSMMAKYHLFYSQPPGEITKPKNEKTRGRPRNIIVQVWIVLLFVGTY